MTKRLWTILLGLLLALTMTACQNETEPQTPEEDAPPQVEARFLVDYPDIEAVLTESIQALEDKDSERYVATYHIEEVNVAGYTYDEIHDYLIQSAEDMFLFFDVRYEIQDMELVEITDDTAIVLATLHSWTDDEDSIYEDSTNVSQLELIKVDGEWLIDAESMYR